MFKQALIHYPEDKDILNKISEALAGFRCEEAVKRIEMIGLSEIQIEALFEEILAEQAKNIP